MEPASVPSTLQPQWFFPLFIAMWLGISGLLALVGGWASLARSFAAQRSIDGERFRFRSGSIGGRFFPVQYGNCLFVTINSEGIGLSVFFLFRFLSPPLFLPWSKMESVEEKRLFFLKYYTLNVRDHWPKVSLQGSAGRSARAAFEAFQARNRGAQVNG